MRDGVKLFDSRSFVPIIIICCVGEIFLSAFNITTQDRRKRKKKKKKNSREINLDLDPSPTLVEHVTVSTRATRLLATNQSLNLIFPSPAESGCE